MFSAAAGDRSDAANVAIVLWDGGQYNDSQQAIDNAITARQRHIRIVAFGVGTDVSQFGLSTIASQPFDKTVFNAKLMSQLSGLQGGLLSAVCDGK